MADIFYRENLIDSDRFSYEDVFRMYHSKHTASWLMQDFPNRVKWLAEKTREDIAIFIRTR